MVYDERVLADECVDVIIGRRISGGAVLGDDPILPRVRAEEAAAGLERLAHGVDVEALIIAEQARVDDRVCERIGGVERQATAWMVTLGQSYGARARRAKYNLREMGVYRLLMSVRK